MSETSQYNTIQAICLTRIALRREQTFDNYEYYSLMCANFLRQLNMKTPYGVRTFRGFADAETNGQITLPDDYVKYVAVGVNYGGQFVTLTYDSGMIQDELPTCDKIEDMSSDCNVGIPFDGYYYGGSYYPAMMTVGGGFNEAYFSEDRANKRIFIKSKFYSHEIIIKYVSLGTEINDYSVIPSAYVEAAQKYMDKIETEHSLSANDSQKNEAKKRYDIAMREAGPLDSDLNYRRFIDQCNRSATKLKFANPDAG